MAIIRTRIAPSPTGIPHIGNTRTALFNYLFAKHNKGEFILRIEDTDRARLVPEAEKAIYDILQWLGLTCDGEVVKQSDRLAIYASHAKELKQKGLAYEDNGAMRFAMPKEGGTEWTDAVGNKKISFQNKDQEDFVIIKTDTYPTYNFANVIDDHEMGITHVIRGDEFISSTPKHIQLYKAFGWDIPTFAHLPVIVGPDKAKLSKRHGAASALEYHKEGYLKEALLNYMALLGWHPGGDQEIMTLDEMIKLFDLNDINTGNPIFDKTKLDWMNGVWIRDKLSVKELKNRLLEFDPTIQKDIPENNLDQFVALAQTRIKTLKEFNDLVNAFMHHKKFELTEEERKFKVKLREELSRVKNWHRSEITDVISSLFLDNATVNNYKTFYKVILGVDRGLPIANVLEILGKEESLKILS